MLYMCQSRHCVVKDVNMTSQEEQEVYSLYSTVPKHLLNLPSITSLNNISTTPSQCNSSFNNGSAPSISLISSHSILCCSCNSIPHTWPKICWGESSQLFFYFSSSSILNQLCYVWCIVRMLDVKYSNILFRKVFLLCPNYIFNLTRLIQFHFIIYRMLILSARITL